MGLFVPMRLALTIIRSEDVINEKGVRVREQQTSSHHHSQDPKTPRSGSLERKENNRESTSRTAAVRCCAQYTAGGYAKNASATKDGNTRRVKDCNQKDTERRRDETNSDVDRGVHSRQCNAQETAEKGGAQASTDIICVVYARRAACMHMREAVTSEFFPE